MGEGNVRLRWLDDCDHVELFAVRMLMLLLLRVEGVVRSVLDVLRVDFLLVDIRFELDVFAPDDERGVEAMFAVRLEDDVFAALVALEELVVLLARLLELVLLVVRFELVVTPAQLGEMGVNRDRLVLLLFVGTTALVGGAVSIFFTSETNKI